MDDQSTYRRIFELAPHSFFLLDGQRQILMVNPAFSEAFGFRGQEVIGRQSSFLFADVRDHEAFWRRARANAPSPVQAMERILMKRRDGSAFPAQVWGPLRQARRRGSPWFLGVVRPLAEVDHRPDAASPLSPVVDTLRFAIKRGDFLPMLLDQILAAFQAQTVFLVRSLSPGLHIELSVGKWRSCTGRMLPQVSEPLRHRIESGAPFTIIGPDLLNDLSLEVNDGRDLTFACVPVVRPGGSSYSLWVGRVQEFAPDELQVLIAVTHLIAQALGREIPVPGAAVAMARLAERLSLLSAAILRDGGTQKALAEVLEVAVQESVADAARVLIREIPDGALIPVAAQGFSESDPWLARSSSWVGLLASVGKYGQRLDVSDLKEGDLPHLPNGRLHAEGFRSYLAVPLASGGEIFGVLEVFSHGPIPSDPARLRLLDALAGQAAIALEMARLKGSANRGGE